MCQNGCYIILIRDVEVVLAVRPSTRCPFMRQQQRMYMDS